MAVANFQEAQAAIYDAFLAAFVPGTIADADTQVALGPEPIDWPAETLCAHFMVVELTGDFVTHGATGARNLERSCAAIVEFRFPLDESDADINTVWQLFKDTFEGVELGPGCYFQAGIRPRPAVQDGRWNKQAASAPFTFWETK